jgi:tetratricopeptide (TPR) repeat protein
VVAFQAGWRTITAWRLGRRQRRSERIDDWEEQGERLVWQGDLRRGRALLQRAWQRRPTNAYPVLALAASYRDAAQLQRARELLTDAATQHHTNPDVLLALAEAHRALGERSAAVAVLERLRALHPHAPRVLRVLRDAYVEAERWQDAMLLQEALVTELRDSKDEALPEREYLGVLRYQVALGQTDAAVRTRSLEALADSRLAPVPVLVSLGDALLAGSREGEASVLWERALRNTPRTVLVERLAGLATEERHRDRLRTLLSKLRAEQVDPDNVRLMTAQLFLADGNADQAARELEALRNPAAAPAVVHRLWAEVYHRRGQLEQAVTAYARADGSLRAHRCTVCERATNDWIGYCLRCGHWDSYRATVEIGLR